MSEIINAFHLLRSDRLAGSSRPYLARGSAVARCGRCLLAELNCICRWRCETRSRVDIVVLMHRDEVLKPTNSGRLIVDVLPENSFVFEWSRTQPDPSLLALLECPDRRVLLLYPTEADERRVVPAQLASPTDGKRLTLVMLDGTWRQAGRMYRLCPWLNRLPKLHLPNPQQGRYTVRSAPAAGQLATAEAAAEALRHCGEPGAAELLAHYFAIFDSHYLASRNSVLADTQSAAHQSLLAWSEAQSSS